MKQILSSFLLLAIGACQPQQRSMPVAESPLPAASRSVLPNPQASSLPNSQVAYYTNQIGCPEHVFQRFQQLGPEDAATLYQTFELGRKESFILRPGEAFFFYFPSQAELQSVVFRRKPGSEGARVLHFEKHAYIHNCLELNTFVMSRFWKKEDADGFYMAIDGGPGDEFSLELASGKLNPRLDPEYLETAQREIETYSEAHPPAIRSRYQQPMLLQTAQAGFYAYDVFKTYGFVFDDEYQPVAGVNVQLQSNNERVPYRSETVTNKDGFYIFYQVPAGIVLGFLASKPGFVTRRRYEVIKGHTYLDANRYDFGSSEPGMDEFGIDYNSLSQKPEVIRVVPARMSTGVSLQTEFVLTFSGPMERESVEKNFRVQALDASSKDRNIWNRDDFMIQWNEDSSRVSFEFKPGRQLTPPGPLQAAARFQVSLDAQDGRLRTFAGTERLDNHFKLTDGDFEASYSFSCSPSMSRR